MPDRSLATTPKRRLTDTQRDQIVELYERGEAFGPELARRFGVHRNTVFRLLKARGAVRGSRVDEAIAAANAHYDDLARRRRLARQQDEAARLARANEIMQSVHIMMQMVFQADREETLAQFGRSLRKALKAA